MSVETSSTTKSAQSSDTAIDAAEKAVDDRGLQRHLSAWHLSFISLGAAIGTGVFLGSGAALANGGPLGLLLGYGIMATVVISVCCCAGEMVTLLPVMGGHLTLAGRFVDPAFGAAASWNYFICWCVVLCAEVSAAAILVDYWKPHVNDGVWIAIFLAFVLAFNSFGAKTFGEAEMYFASMKLVTIAVLVVLGIVVCAGGTTRHDRIGFRYWRDPGPLQQYLGIPGSTGRFLGFFSVLTQAAFCQIGSEMLALAAAETRNPRRAIPRALQSVWIRVIAFYLSSVFVIGLIVPSNDPALGTTKDATSSPFVIAIHHAGIAVLPSIVNAAILAAALSAGCADLFTTSRALHSMACCGQAPAIFKRTLRNGNPYYAALASWSTGLLAFLSINRGSGRAFQLFVNLSAVSGVLTWWVIAVTYLRFWRAMRAQGIDRRSFLPWSTRYTPVMAVWALCLVSTVIVFTGWPSLRPESISVFDFFSAYLPLAWFVLLYLVFKLRLRSKLQRARNIDLRSGLDEFDSQEQTWDKVKIRTQ